MEPRQLPGQKQCPQAPATPLGRAGFYLACLVAPPSCPKSPKRCRYSLVCGFLLGKGARFWLGTPDEKQVGYRRPRRLLLKHGDGRRKVPLCHRLRAEGACGAWQGQRSLLRSRGGGPQVPGSGVCCYPGGAKAGPVFAPSVRRALLWGSGGAAEERGAGVAHCCRQEKGSERAMVNTENCLTAPF